MNVSKRHGSKHARADALRREQQHALALRRRIEAAAEALIDLLDQLDAPSEDLEPDADWEPWLAAPEGHPCQLFWCLGCDDDREHEHEAQPGPQEIGP